MSNIILKSEKEIDVSTKLENKIVIQLFDESDAKAVSELYNKCDFYMFENGYKISENDIIASNNERGTICMIVAKYSESVIAVLGAFPVSGQKVSEKDTVFVGSLLIHPEFRNNTTIIKMYSMLIKKVVRLGYLRMDTEILPGNKLSLGLAQKTGFVRTKDCATDYDNYIDLHSYLPSALQCFTKCMDIHSIDTDVYESSFNLNTRPSGSKTNITEWCGSVV